MFTKAFASDYTSFDSTGATHITQHTKIKLVGIDYLSIGCLEDIVETHRILLGNVSHGIRKTLVCCIVGRLPTCIMKLYSEVVRVSRGCFLVQVMLPGLVAQLSTPLRNSVSPTSVVQ